jgi:hypothetical protein
MSTSAYLGGTLPNGEGDSNKVATYNDYINTVLEPAVGALQASLAAPTWTAPALLHSWVNYGGGTETAGYTKVGGVVYLRGLVKSGVLTLPIFTLPAGYRPAGEKDFIVFSNGAAGYVYALNNGDVIADAPSNNTFVSLCGVSFPAEA